MDLLIDLLAPILAAVVAFIGGRMIGRSRGRIEAREEAERARADTHERMSDADTGIGDGADEHREWLRDRGRR